VSGEKKAQRLDMQGVSDNLPVLAYVLLKERVRRGCGANPLGLPFWRASFLPFVT